jgi:hypothetical protein
MLHADYFANPHYLLSTQRYAYESLEVVAFLDMYRTHWLRVRYLKRFRQLTTTIVAASFISPVEADDWDSRQLRKHTQYRSLCIHFPPIPN